MLPLRMLGLLMLLCLLCEAETTCPTDENPLTLEPPEIIGEYGHNFTLNCSSTFDDHDGLSWINIIPDPVMDEFETYITGTKELLDWNATGECRIKKNESSECSKELKIIVYRNPVRVVVLPVDHGAAVEGKNYQLQCDILDVAPVENLVVRWYKGSQVIRTDTFNKTTKTPVNVSSVLEVNLSRGDDGVTFTCEAQLDFGPKKLPVISETHNVSVHYGPEIIGKTEESVTLQEGENFTLICEAEGNPPPQIGWARDGENMTEDTNNLSITRVKASAQYTCKATNYLGVKKRNISVNVLKNTMTTPVVAMATTMPEASAQMGCPLVLTPAELVVRFRDPASATCTTTDPNISLIGWEVISGGKSLDKSSSVTWRVESLEFWIIEPKCYITLDSGLQCTANLPVTVYKTPDNVVISALTHGPMLEGREYWLKCDIVNVAPVQNLTVQWYRDREYLKTEMFNQSLATPMTVSSTLRVIPKRDYDGARFSCIAQLNLGQEGSETISNTTSEPYTNVVYYKPLMQNCSHHYTQVEPGFRLDRFPCKPNGYPTPTVHWYFQGEPINVSEPLTRRHSGNYTAEFENMLGRSFFSVNIIIEYIPLISCNGPYEVVEGTKLQTLCEPEGIPPPIVTWLKNGKKKVSQEGLTKNESGIYTLSATNKHGTVTHTLYLDVLFAPEFKEGNYSKVVTQGDNVTFDCHAEGNPAPVIYWNYTSAENLRTTANWGRQNYIKVTGATSTDAGVYICVATNKVGSVSRSVTLILRGKTSGSPMSLILGLLFALAVFLVLLTILCKRQRKHGQYSFIPDRAVQGSEIPMSNQMSVGTTA